ncbi:MAG: NAD-dependent epimerase/dehydratase family protein [Thermoflexales bacterium]|nr:NAD-dependent epimerase/dehydratase family protein [Thermoflexales bacterium]
MKPILVLGATGFIGGQIARAAAEAGHDTRAGRRRADAVGAIGDVPVHWVRADLEDEASLVDAMRGCGVVIHAAASYPQNFRKVSAEVARAEAEIRRVLTAARTAGVERFIYTSSLTTTAAWTAGQGPGRLADERDFYQPGSARSAYYEAKLAMERIVLDERVLPTVALLPTAVFGPGDIKPTTGLVLLEAARGHFPVVFDATLDVVDGRDVAASHLAAIERGVPGERYILGGHAISVADLIGLACRIAGRKPPTLRVSRGLVGGAIGLADALPFVSLPENIRMFRFWQALNSEKAARVLGHRARPVEDMVRDTLAWFATQGRR